MFDPEETNVTFPHPLNEPLATLVADRFRVLSEPMRLRLLDQLRDGPATVTALAGTLGCSQQNVSRHLAVLRTAGLVQRDRRGASTLYRTTDPEVYVLCEEACDEIRRQVDGIGTALRGAA